MWLAATGALLDGGSSLRALEEAVQVAARNRGTILGGGFLDGFGGSRALPRAGTFSKIWISFGGKGGGFVYDKKSREPD